MPAGEHQPATGAASLAAAALPATAPQAAALAADDPQLWAAVQRETDRLLAAEGAGYVHDLDLAGAAASASRPWRLDARPIVITDAVFATLERVVERRVRLLDAVLADLYGPRRLITDGVLPPAVAFSSPRYRLTQVGAPAPLRWLATYAVDVLRRGDGSWCVVQDLTDAPSGLGYALLNRSVLSRAAATAFRSAPVAPLGGFTAELRRAIAATSSVGSPRMVLFTGGVRHPSYVEQSYLAVQLGFNLAEGGDLVVRGDRVWLRTVGGLEEVDVLYRRLEDAAADPLHVDTLQFTGVPGLGEAARRGGVTLANALGSGLAEEHALRPYLDDAASLLGCDAPAMPMFDSGRDRVDDDTIVVRLHAVAHADTVVVLAGGNGRVLAPGDRPDAPTARVARDVWVIRHGAPVVIRRPMPQVDLAASIPTRVADALYGLGRAAERAEAAARTVRVVTAQLDENPALADSRAWSSGAGALLAASAGPSVETIPDDVGELLPVSSHAVGQHLGVLLGEAFTVREFLSVATGRVLGDLGRLSEAIAGRVPSSTELDSVLTQLAAFAGLWNESTVRGPAWRFGDLGRRLERGLVVARTVDAVLTGATGPTTIDPLAVEALLAANESLVAYRRRHRSDVENGAVVRLLLRDDTNPRGLAFQLDRLREHVVALGWAAGGELLEPTSRLLFDDGDVASPVGEIVDALVALDQAVFQRWFAVPIGARAAGRWQ